MTIRRVLSLALIAGALATSGCVGRAVAPAPPSSTASKTPWTAPKPSAPASGPSAMPRATAGGPPVDSLVVSPDGVGDIRIGAAIPASAQKDLVMWDPTSCEGSWYPAYETTAEGTWPFLPVNDEWPATRESPIVRIEVQSRDIRTSDGLGVGSTSSELLAAGYTEIGGADELAGMQAFVLDGAHGRLIMWVAAGNNQPPELDHVTSMRVVPTGDAPEMLMEIAKCE